MNNEVGLLGAISLVSLSMAVLFWFSPSFTKRLIGENDPFEKKIFHKNLPFWQLLMLTVFVPCVMLILVLLMVEIESRHGFVSTGVHDREIRWVLMVVFSMILYGLGSHGASVSIGHYMVEQKDSRAYRAVEFYHHIFSHFLTIIGIIVGLVVFAIWEISLPQPTEIKLYEILITTLGGMFFGTVLGFVIIEGRAKYYGIPAIIFALIVLVFLTANSGLSLPRLPIVIYLYTSFSSSLATIVYWRIKNGELKETLGEFFHDLETT